jgi:hypothetical protein
MAGLLLSPQPTPAGAAFAGALGHRQDGMPGEILHLMQVQKKPHEFHAAELAAGWGYTTVYSGAVIS